MKNVLVVGGGISGIRIASQLDSSMYNVTIISPEPGGLLAQHVIEQWGAEWRFDYGGHVYAPGTSFARYLETLPHTRTIDKREAYYSELVDDGINIVDYPVQDFASDLRNPLRVEYPQAVPAYSGQSLATFANQTFGSEFVDGWFRPFNERVWTTQLETMDSDWITTRVRIPDGKPKGDWGPNASFLYCPGDAFIYDMLDYAINDRGVRYIDGKVRYFEFNKIGQFSVYGAYAEHIMMSDILISTLPITMTVGALGQSIANAAINKIWYACVMTNRPFSGDKDFHWLYGDITTPVHRITHLSRYHETLAPKFGESYLFEIPMKHSAEVDHTYSLVVDNYMRSFGFARGEYNVEYCSSLGYPIPMLGIRHDVSAAKTTLRDANVYSIGRWGSHAYFNADHIFDEADNLAAFLNGDETNQRLHSYLWSDHYYGVYK